MPLCVMKYLVLHHSDYGQSGKQVNLINQWHKNRGFRKSLLGYHVGYHFVIEESGEVTQTRVEDEVGSHAGPYDDKTGRWIQYKKWGKTQFNEEGIGVCLARDLSTQDPTPAQLKALTSLVFDLQIRHGIPDENVILHRDVKPTTCPVKNLRELYLGNRTKHLQERYNKAITALRWAKGDRYNRLMREIARIKLLLNVD